MKQTEAELKKLLVLPADRDAHRRILRGGCLCWSLKDKGMEKRNLVAKKKSMSPNKRSKEQGSKLGKLVVWKVQTLGVGERCLPLSGRK